DMKDFAAMNKVWDAWIADKPKPARACVEAHMARPNILVELCVTAAQ
ncbi:Rid family hydrolase, partial [Neptunomonas sp.]